MFEFTEDKKSIRPKYIGTIKSNWKRRAAMIVFMPFTILAVLLFNYTIFTLWTTVAAWRMIIIGTIKPLISPFKKPEYWDSPRVEIKPEDVTVMTVEVNASERKDRNNA